MERYFAGFSALVIRGIASGALCFAMASVAQAASQTWSSTGASTNWSDSSNWGGNAAPGSTSTTTSTDVATFASAVGTVGTSGNPIIIDSTTQDIGMLEFAGSTGSFTVGSTSGNSLYFTGTSNTPKIIMGNTGFTLSNSSTVTETINAPLLVVGTTGLTLENDSSNGTGANSGILNLGGTVSVASTSSAVLFTLRGSNTNANVVSGIISNGSSTKVSINKTDLGTWDLTGLNTFSGNITVQDGTLNFNSIADGGLASALGEGTSIGLGQNSAAQGLGKLQFTGASGGSSNRVIAITNGASGGAGSIENTVAGQTLTLSGGVTVSTPASATSLTLTGVGDGVLSGGISGAPALALVKSGTGTWAISGTNTYTGSTTVNAGTLDVQSSISASATAVNSTGKLTGTSSVGALTLASGGTISPGDATTALSAGTNTTLSATSLAFTQGGQLTFALSSTNANSTALTLSGALTKVTGTGAFTISLSGGFNSAGTTYDLLNWNGTATFAATDFTLSTSGLNSGVTGQLQVLNPSGSSFELAYVEPVPEPATWAMLLGGMMALVFWQRRGRGSNLR